MKKYITASFLLGFLLITPIFAHATDPIRPIGQTYADQIAALQAQIAALTAQLNQLLAQQNNGHNLCHTFTRDLFLGSTSAGGEDTTYNVDLSSLKKVLNKEGFSNFPDDSTDLFDLTAKNAVIKFQTKYGLPATGFVGPLTRGVLNRLYSNCHTQGNGPVISGVSGPTTLSVGQQGTWTVNASDPNGGNVLYGVTWGDENMAPPQCLWPAGSPGGPCVFNYPANSFVQNATFTHSYNQPGVFTVQFYAQNSIGQNSKVNITVNVGGQNSPSGITVTSPNGGEIWTANTTKTIAWTLGAGVSANANVDIYLDKNVCQGGPNTACPAIYFTPILLDRNIPGNGAYNWIVATDINNNPIPVGLYKVKVCLAGTTNPAIAPALARADCDSSDAPFTITGTPNTNQITVTNPNDGGAYAPNSILNIKWTAGLTSASRYDLYLDEEVPACVNAVPRCLTAQHAPYVLDRNIADNSNIQGNNQQNVYSWIVATDINNAQIPPDLYRVRICSAGSTTNCDSSDAPFVIQAIVHWDPATNH